MQSLSSSLHFPVIVRENEHDHRLDEYEDLVQLLLDHAVTRNETIRTLASFIAKICCTGENHLWQDMGLPNRAALSSLMQANFPALVAKNAGDMKWKKFFYRQLCERAEILICKSPSCGVCIDYDKCFGSEEE